MRESKQSASVRELIAHLEIENAKLRDRASKLMSQVQALREAVGDSENIVPRSIGGKGKAMWRPGRLRQKPV
jgi:hypothetical protein